ncbi:MAG: YeiH family protein [Candidatus Sericytochromatia bacterium]
MINTLRSLMPGVGLSALLAGLSIWISRGPELPKGLPLSPLLLAIFMGLLLGNLRSWPALYKPGLTFSLKKILRLGIILLGFKISLSQVQSIGWQGLILLSLTVCSSFFFTIWLGKRLGLSSKLSLLLASGTSICGASAIVATDAVIEAEEQDCAYAVATITLMGTLAMTLYPLAQMALHFSPQVYGVWVGASIHEVAQVIAAGFAHGDQSGQVASLVKMTRVVYLVPVIFGLLAWHIRIQSQNETKKLNWKELPLPWFVLLFVGMIGVNSLQILPAKLVQGLVEIDLFLICMSMSALGLETRLDKLRATGLKPLWLGLGASIFISLTSLGLLAALYPLF